MNQPGKPGSSSNPKLGRLLDVADDVSIPVLTERVAVPPPPSRAAPAASFTLDTDLPSFATQPVVPPAPLPRVPAPATAAAPERPAAPRAVAPSGATVQPFSANGAAPMSAMPTMPAMPTMSTMSTMSPASSGPPVLPAPPAAAAVPAAGARPLPAAAAGAERGEQAAAGPPALPGPAPWGRIEIELRESILMDLAERLPREVESIVRGNMSAAIDMLVDRLSAETRIAVAASLRDIIDHAVKAELERLRNSRR